MTRTVHDDVQPRNADKEGNAYSGANIELVQGLVGLLTELGGVAVEQIKQQLELQFEIVGAALQNERNRIVADNLVIARQDQAAQKSVLEIDRVRGVLADTGAKFQALLEDEDAQVTELFQLRNVLNDSKAYLNGLLYASGQDSTDGDAAIEPEKSSPNNENTGDGADPDKVVAADATSPHTDRPKEPTGADDTVAADTPLPHNPIAEENVGGDSTVTADTPHPHNDKVEENASGDHIIAADAPGPHNDNAGN